MPAFCEESFKVIVVGDGNVGKTSMLRRFVRGDFLEEYRRTIGAEYMEKTVFLDSSNTTVKLMLWDTAGQEMFSALTQAYYRGAAAAIIAFSTTDRDSFAHVLKWKNAVESVCGPITMVLCQTKLDLLDEAAVTSEEAERLAEQLLISFFRVSTRDDFNVTQLFEFTAEQCVEAQEQSCHAETSSPAACPVPVVAGGGVAHGQTLVGAAPSAAQAAPAVTPYLHGSSGSDGGTSARQNASSTPAPLCVATPVPLPVPFVPRLASTTATVEQELSVPSSGERKKVKLRRDGKADANKKKKLKCAMI